ncbi:MAG TPA: helicase associated domain-containing protein [Arthrobacter sp.]
MSTAVLPRTRNRKQLLDWAIRQKHVSLSDAQAHAMDTAYPQWRYKLDDKWLVCLNDLVEFFNANQRFPSSASEDTVEKRLGVWLITQRQNAETLREDRRGLLDEELPGWAEKQRKSWDLRFEEVCAIVDDLGRIPFRTDESPAARSAANWLYNNKRLPATDPRVLALNSRIPGWNISYQDIWHQKLSDVVAFHSTRGILPNKKSKDPVEKSLWVWLDTCRTKWESMPAERRQLLDTGLPGWRRTRDSIWNDYLNLVGAFIAEHDRFPRAKAEAAEEAALGTWLLRQRSKADSLDSSRRKVLDERIPGWMQGTPGWGQKDREDTWADMLEQCVEFVHTHGKLPVVVAGQEPSEKRIAVWLRNQRAVKNKMPEDRRGTLARRLPMWDITLEEIWQEKLQMSVDFVRVHGRMPSSGKRAPEDEQELGRWLIVQRKNAAKLQRDGVLDANLPGWR